MKLVLPSGEVMKDYIIGIIKSHNYVPIWKNNKLTSFVNNEEIVFYEVRGKNVIITLFWFNNEHMFGTYKTSKLMCKKSDEDNFVKLSRNAINIKFGDWFLYEFIPNIVDSDVNEVHILDNIKKYEFENNILKINKKLMLQINEGAFIIFNKVKSYGNAVKTYLTNKLLGDLNLKNVRKRTLIEKEELSFLIDRMNLDIKRAKKDFDEILSESDLNNTQILIKKMLELGVFEKEFIEVLDDYFIRKRLDDVLKIGNSIISLKSSRMDTSAAKKIKEENPNLNEVNILEELWQKFFEENLLYLLFSYQELYPKIELNIRIDDQLYAKKPDFIGVNHYGGVDIIEIKHHLTPILTYDSSHKNFVMTSDLSKAIMQATNYMAALIENQFTNENISNEIKRNILAKNLNRPNAIIIISSIDNLVKKGSKNSSKRELIQRDFTRIRNSLHNITILTFDEVLNIATRYKNNIVLNETNTKS